MASSSWLVWEEALPGQQHSRGVQWGQASLVLRCLGLATTVLGCGHVRAL